MPLCAQRKNGGTLTSSESVRYNTESDLYIGYHSLSLHTAAAGHRAPYVTSAERCQALCVGNNNRLAIKVRV